MSRSKKSASDLTVADLDKKIDSGEVDLLYLLLGEEAYLKDHLIKKLTLTVDESFRDFNVSRHSLADTSIVEILDAARQTPMMAKRRLMVVSDLDKIKDEASTDALIDYLGHPADTATLVFLAVSLDGRRRYAMALQKACIVVKCDHLEDAQARGWAEKYLRARGVAIEVSALNILVGLTGGNLLRLQNEMEKLITYAGNAKRITSPDVESLVTRTKQHTAFDLGDALIADDRKKALRLLHRLIADKNEPVAIVGMLAWAYRRALITKDLMMQNAPMNEISREAKVSPYKQEFFAQIRRIDLKTITFAVKRIAEVDLAIKTSSGTPTLQLEHLICELTS